MGTGFSVFCFLFLLSFFLALSFRNLNSAAAAARIHVFIYTLSVCRPRCHRRLSFSPYLFILYNKSIQYDFVAIQIVETAQHQHSLSEVCRRIVFVVHSPYVVVYRCRRFYCSNTMATTMTTTTSATRENGSKWLSRSHSIVCPGIRKTSELCRCRCRLLVLAILFDPCCWYPRPYALGWKRFARWPDNMASFSIINAAHIVSLSGMRHYTTLSVRNWWMPSNERIDK